MKALLFLSILCGVVSCALSARAAEYTITNLGTFVGGGTSIAQAISDNGQVAGYAYTAGNYNHAFLDSGGAMHDLGSLATDPLSQRSEAFGVNDSGQVTGWSYSDSGYQHVFLYDTTGMHDLGGLSQYPSIGYAINNAGQVTGSAVSPTFNQDVFLWNGTQMLDIGTLGGISQTGHKQGEGMAINATGQVTGDSVAPGGYLHAFLYNGTQMHDLGLLPGATSTAQSYGTAINDLGQVAGYANMTAGGIYHAMLYNAGGMHDLGTLGTYSNAYGINNSGAVVGESIVSLDLSHAFVYTAATGMLDLNSLITPNSGWVLESATAINDHGQIAGYGTINGATRAFLLTPVPEPGTWVLAALGLIALIGVAGHKQGNLARR